MSLFDGADIGIMEELMEPCEMLDRSTADQPDGQGGWNETYAPGATFDAMFIKNNSTEAQIAQQQKLKEMYTVVVLRNTPIRHGDVFRRKNTGETFRATGSVKDGAAPPSSTVPIAKFTAEPWEVPA